MRNPWLCLAIVAMLGAGAIVSTVGVIILALNHIDAPQALTVSMGGCWGALGTFLVNPPRGQIGMGSAEQGQQFLIVKQKPAEAAP